jgi:transposase-like protein
MYVQGVSTRKVAAITEELCGLEVSSVQVSRAAALLDEELAAWRNRPLGEIPYLILDARYEKIRHGGAVVSCAVLVAIGVSLPAAHRHKLRTTNMLERISKEIKRRTLVATLFPNEASALRLVTAVLMEISEDWGTNRTYLAMETH